MNRLLPVLCLILTACGNDSKLARVSQTDTFYQEITNEVDILWVVDNSLSMGDEQAELADKFDRFIVSMEDVGLDWQIGVVTTDMEASGQSGRLQGTTPILTADVDNYEGKFSDTVTGLGIDGSDKEAGIDAAWQALTTSLVSTENAGFLRDEAKLSIIYVSDENDCTNRGALAGLDGDACYDHSDLLTPMSTLIDQYQTLKSSDSRLIVSAIVGPPVSAGCLGAVPGFRYDTMAAAFGGLQASICEDDFSDIMTQLGLQTAGLYTSFRLTYAAVLETIEVYVDEVAVSESAINGWTYDDTYQMLYFWGAAIPSYDTTIRVTYDVAGAGVGP